MRRIAFLALAAAAGLFAWDASEDLLAAARDGDLNAAKSAVEKGAPIESKTAYGQTALFLAAMNGHEPVVAFLLEKGASADITDTFYKSTMLFTPARASNRDQYGNCQSYCNSAFHPCSRMIDGRCCQLTPDSSYLPRTMLFAGASLVKGDGNWNSCLLPSWRSACRTPGAKKAGLFTNAGCLFGVRLSIGTRQHRAAGRTHRETVQRFGDEAPHGRNESSKQWISNQ